ncbi:hypothetical protein Bca4012_055890 [Brassica carinata]
MGLYKFLVQVYTAMRNWELVLVVPEETVRLHRSWLTGQQRPQINERSYLETTRVINFVEKDISEMWPKWDSEVEDVPAENIIKVMYDRRPWKWTKDCWEVTGTKKTKEIEMVVRIKFYTVIESGFAMEICSRYDADANTLLR